MSKSAFPAAIAGADSKSTEHTMHSGQHPQLPVLKTFISLVLPEEGWLCAFIGNDKSHAFFKTDEEFANYLLQQDGMGRTSYHSCASFKEPINRLRVNVSKQRSLRSDVDCGGEGQYRDREEALRELVSFLQTTRIPWPLAVASGNGLHCYWPLSDDVDNDTWLALSRALKAKMVQYGFKADHRCTVDSVRVLRPPGTTNRKHGAVPVRMGNIVAPIPVEQLQAALSVRSSFRPDITAAAKAVYSGPEIPADAEAIANECAHMRTMRDTKGRLSQPLWYACLQVLARCNRGKEFAHAWSTGDNRYSPTEVDAKIDQALQLSGPAKCSQFEESAPEVCGKCPHHGKITTPCQLGRQTAKVNAEDRLTDLGNARRLVQLHGNNLRFIPNWRKWLYWTGERWMIDDDGQIMRLPRQRSKPCTQKPRKSPTTLSGPSSVGTRSTPTRDNSFANSSRTLALPAKPPQFSHASDRFSALASASTAVHGAAPKHAACQRLLNSSGLSRCNADGSFTDRLTSFAR
jgi:hypothetical protein